VARRSKGPTDRDDDDGVLDYRHGARRLNNPPAGLVSSNYVVVKRRENVPDVFLQPSPERTNG
jgi:hypothetical protein